MKITDDNYYIVQGWMINRLGLKGTQLEIFAIIYGFCQDRENEYVGGLQYLCDFLGGITKRSVMTALKGLTDKNYLIKRDKYINNVKYCTYGINFHTIEKISLGYGNIVQKGGEKISPNNEIYINNCISNNTIVENDTVDDSVKNNFFVNQYHSICKDLPKCMKLSAIRQKHLNALLKMLEEQAIPIEDYLSTINSSDFLCGRTGQFKAGFDWIINKSNALKVIEGTYKNRTVPNKKNNDDIDWDTRYFNP